MNRIRLLSEQVANQIAAGEVVDRPASVVKELVENSIDSGATRIHVEIESGGRSLIRVTDDGQGMSRDDALLCLERHATSKISQAEDLFSLSTMGFRGEAIPSIASVSKLNLTTKERNTGSIEASQIIVHGGRVVEVKTTAATEGTVMEVRHLFFNLPARRKFLRSDETEAAHIQHYLMLAALAHPSIGWMFRKDNRIIWQLPPLPTGVSALEALEERFRFFAGAEVPLVPVSYQATLEATGFSGDDSPGQMGHPMRIWGWIGAPGVSRSNRNDQRLFVNQRPVENKGLNFALLEGYHNALMKGRYPLCCLFLDVPPSMVDVNIHPAKREVRFHQEHSIRSHAAQAIRHALQEYGMRRVPLPERSSEPPALSLANLTTETLAVPQSPTQVSRSEVRSVSFEENEPTPLRSASPQPTWAFAATEVVELREKSTELVHPAGNHGVARAEIETTHGRPHVPILEKSLRPIGIFSKLYVLLEADSGLVLMDQHAAHERVLYEQALERLDRSENCPSQKLLLPETVELSPHDTQFVRDNLLSLNRLGVSLHEFGERTFLLEGLPPFARPSAPRQFVLQLIDELAAAGAGINQSRLGEDVITKLVCRHSIKANDTLKLEEVASLLSRLRSCKMPYTCPHGRPTVVELTHRDLEKKFGRSA